MIYLRLFYEFFKTGLFAIGGGMATIPFLSEMGERTGWFSQALLADMLAVSESTPGPVGINMATYVGYTVGGVAGGVIATLGEITPSIICILIVAALLKSFRQSRIVENVLYGIRPASTGLISAAGIGVLWICMQGTSGQVLNWKGVALFALIWVLTNPVKQTRNLHPIVFIAFAAAVGIVFRFVEV